MRSTKLFAVSALLLCPSLLMAGSVSGSTLPGDCSHVPCQAATQSLLHSNLRALDFPAAMIVQGRGRSAETSVIHL